MLSFEEKLAICNSFPQLTRHNVSLGRVNFHFNESVYDKKIVVYHLHPNGNGFVYAEYIEGYDIDHKGMVNIRDFTEKELRKIITDSIQSLAPRPTNESAIIGEAEEEEYWVNDENNTLILIYEDEMWNVYAGLNLDGTFLSYNEAAQYLMEEGFKQK